MPGSKAVPCQNHNCVVTIALGKQCLNQQFTHMNTDSPTKITYMKCVHCESLQLFTHMIDKLDY